MLGGARAKPVLKSGWGEEGRGQRRIGYGRRKMGGLRITVDRLSPQTPELSPFSALLKENQKRQWLNTTIGDSPAICTSDPLELSTKKDLLSSFVPSLTSSPVLPGPLPCPETSSLTLRLSGLSIKGPTPDNCSQHVSPSPTKGSEHTSPSLSSCREDVSPPGPAFYSGEANTQCSPLAHDGGNISVESCDPESARRSDGHSFAPHAAAGERSLKSQLVTPGSGLGSTASRWVQPGNEAKSIATRLPFTPRLVQGCPHVASPLLRYLSPSHSVPLGARDKALALCQQQDPLPLQDIFSDTMRNTLTKLGEGAFAEVFGCLGDDRNKMALKIIPIEGDFLYNDEKQASFQGILPEMVITRELNQLGEETNKENVNSPHFTSNFLQIYWMSVRKGKFPDFLMDAWEDYDHEQKSENDVPDIFSDKQLYVVFASEDAGIPLEEFVFHSFNEALSIMTQVTGALAVGEAALEFEHRDLHYGNVLVRRTHEETVYLRLGGVDYLILTHGVQATIVDYTLSRIKQGECVSYNNLSKMEWLFTGKGDIQFQVYRDMKKASNSNWESFMPASNVLWVNYMASKISQKGRLKGVTVRAWRLAFRHYRTDAILKHSSAVELFINVFAPKS